MMKQKKQSMCFKHLFVIAAVSFALFSGLLIPRAFGVETEGPGDENETPSYANPAQAQHAANLAEAAAAQVDEETQEALSAIEEAEAALDEAEEAGIQAEIDAALADLAIAQEAYADLIAEKTGVYSKDIVDMRNAGMGWGQIAHELGVHPGLLGIGHTKKSRAGFGAENMNEMAEATSRNARSGWSKGHGVGLNAGVGSANPSRGGLALGHTKGDRGKGGIGGAAGLSSSKGPGNSGGHGGGNGKGGSAGQGGGPGNSGNGPGGGHGPGGNSGHGSGGGHGNGGNSGNGNGGGHGGGHGK